MKKPLSLSRLPWFRKRRRSATSAAARRRRPSGGSLEIVRPWWLCISPPRVALGAGVSLLLSLLLCIHLWPSRVSLGLGDIADQEIVAPRSVRFQDTELTRRLRDEAAAQQARQYDVDPTARGAALRAVQEFFDAAEKARAASGPPPGKAAKPGVPAPLPAAGAAPAARPLGRDLGHLGPWAAALRAEAAPVREAARQASLSLVERAMGRQIREGTDDLEAARAEIARNAAAVQTVPPRLRGLVVAVASAALRPDYRFNEERTEQQREKARAQVPPQMVPIPSGTVLLRPGDRVTRQHLDAFAALGLQNPRLDAATMAAISGLVVALVVLVAIYLALFHADLYHDMSRLLLLAILALVSVVGLKIGSNLLGLPISGFGYLGVMCVASAGMAIALLLSPAVATLIVGLLAVVSGLILHHELRFTVITLASSLVGIVSVATLRNRGDLVRATVLLCGANVVLNLLVGQIEGDTPRELGTGALWGIISGLFALVLFWIGVAVFEKPFGITTHLRLLELSDPATPILQAFRMRVPGTYAHSLMVGNLAHAAAEAIGANGLLVRVAAYYHDLGKMNRPEFFIENQGNAENVHDRLNPSLSALVLTSHVKEGLEMAAEVGLPPRVCDVIRQHHGTSLMKYFYFRATGGARDATLEAQFRYAGPKPQTKEAAILMLADSVEAASRTLDKPTPQRIADFVARMIEDKRADGQLDECDLTLRDLRTIQDVFARTLCGTLHMRIEYPGSAASSTAGAAPTDLPPLAATASSSPIAMATFPEEALAGALTVVEGGTGTGGGTADPGPPAPPSSSSRKPEAITEALADGDDHPNGNNGGGGAARPVSGGADAGGRHQAAR